MDLKSKLQELIDLYAIQLPPRTCVSELDRWENLIFCLLRQFSEQKPALARSAVTVMRDLDLLDTSNYSTEEEGAEYWKDAVKQVLISAGFQEDRAEDAVDLLFYVSKSVNEEYQGRLHLMIRKHSEVIRDELINAFSHSSISEDQLNFAVSLWLQNSFRLPIPVASPAVTDFCAENGSTPEDLWRVADEMNINLGIVDFLLEKDRSS